jgi:hypothetical protein
MDKPSNPKDAIGIRKAPMSTVSATVLAEVGVAMLEGAAKYGRHNYRAVGVQSSVYYDATMRHLMDWWEGVDIDPDSGMNHITKAITSLVVLRDAMIQGMLTDDRPPRSAEFYSRLNELAGAILDRHADKSPRHYTIADSDAGMREHAAREDDARLIAESNAYAVGAKKRDLWINWHGGECPVPHGTTVQYKNAYGEDFLSGSPEQLSWSHNSITAYRVVPT